MIGGGEPAPELSVPLRRVSGLRYGENPHQPAAFYSDLSLAESGRGGIAGAIQHHGKEVTHSFPPCIGTLHRPGGVSSVAYAYTVHHEGALLPTSACVIH